MRKFTWLMVILAMVTASCTNDEQTSNIQSDPNQIGFYTSTTRASVTNLATLEASSIGFVIYAASGNAPTAWFTGIDGTNNYKKGGSVWGWNTGSPQWPTIPEGYPMNFYAYFAPSYTGLTLTTPTPSSMTGSYTIQPEANQADFLVAKSTAAYKPFSGMLPMTFNHILSKINFGVIPGNKANVHVQSVNVNNVGNQRSYDFLTGDWTAVQPAAFASNYVYKKTATPATSLIGVDPTEKAAISVTPTYENLMLMPQTAITWAPATGVAAAAAYMSIIYRLEMPSDPDAVGYAKANTHPNYSTLEPTAKAVLDGKPLFVKVGYPFASKEMTWEKGKGYTYNICLGTANASNGYIVDNFYYDENGKPTTLPIIGKKVGDPISNGNINFTVNVTNWDEQTPSTIQ